MKMFYIQQTCSILGNFCTVQSRDINVATFVFSAEIMKKRRHFLEYNGQQQKVLKINVSQQDIIMIVDAIKYVLRMQNHKLKIEMDERKFRSIKEQVKVFFFFFFFLTA